MVDFGLRHGMNGVISVPSFFFNFPPSKPNEMGRQESARLQKCTVCIDLRSSIAITSCSYSSLMSTILSLYTYLLYNVYTLSQIVECA